ncbi:MAG: alpha-ketoglutarate-dependent 2,4-dichlorophenoxyacetate dioxygenase [Gammaproteobacteria bacterium]|jgi:alpha-ketoglutarate-dependent 2,4-dichlorophenoxyacetate dioxygenase
MTIEITPVGPQFVARVRGVDLLHGLDNETFAILRKALDDHSILILPDQPMDDEGQMAFSAWWGPMEPTKGVNPASGTPFARQSNLDIKTGAIIPPDDRRMAYQKGNYQWHADSTFKPVPSLCSILTARQVPPEGGNTEFVSTRAAYEALPEEIRESVEGLIVEHDLAVSRGRVGFTFTAQEAALHPPVWHPLVQTNPVTGRCSLLVGAHASRIIDWPLEKGQTLLEDLLARATVPCAVYSHHWSDGDVVVWDNRAALHRATAYDTVRYRRLMQRTTIGNPDILQTPVYRQISELRAAAGDIPASQAAS